MKYICFRVNMRPSSKKSPIFSTRYINSYSLKFLLYFIDFRQNQWNKVVLYFTVFQLYFIVFQLYFTDFNFISLICVWLRLRIPKKTTYSDKNRRLYFTNYENSGELNLRILFSLAFARENNYLRLNSPLFSKSVK